MGRASIRPAKSLAALTGEDQKPLAMPIVEGVQDRVDLALRHRMISEAAYYLYMRRACVPGHDLDDWLRAEAQIDNARASPRQTGTHDWTDNR